MKALSHDEGRQRSAWIADERGFTLIELLVATVVSLIVIGGGIYGIARAFNVSNASNARVTATSNGEVGLERVVTDLRDAVNGSCPYNKTTVTGVSVQLNGSVTTIQLCDPNTNVASATNAPPSEGVQWQCNTGSTGTNPPPETCIRSVDTGTLATPAVATGSEIVGVQMFSVRGILNSVTPPVYLPCDNATVCTAAKSVAYTLNSGTSVSLSWVGITAGIGQNSTPGAGGVATVNASSTLAFSTGAALLNYGTS
jgi:prepilin-type N-terminal cleavage/methylation domain-containing protein